MKTAEILTELRKNASLTQKELAKQLQIAQSTIVGYEQGKNEPIAKILSLYADFFDVTVDYLLGREDDFGIAKPNSNIGQSTDRKFRYGEKELSPTEEKIIDCFRQLDVYQRQAFEIQIVALAEQADKIKK